jgi:hypothetical protein
LRCSEPSADSTTIGTADQPRTRRHTSTPSRSGRLRSRSVLLPRRSYRRAWHRLLHDRTADAIASAVSDLAHANVTFVPYHLGR